MYVKVKVNYLLLHLMIKYRNPWPYCVFSVSPAMNSCWPSQQDRSTELSQAHYSSFCFGFLCTCCLLLLECFLTFVSHENACSSFSIWFWFFQPPWRLPPSLNPSLLSVPLSDFILMAYLNASLPCYLMSSLNTGLYSVLFIFVFPTQDCPLFIRVWSAFLQFYIERQKKR